jgi:hypothetical protein
MTPIDVIRIYIFGEREREGWNVCMYM